MLGFTAILEPAGHAPSEQPGDRSDGALDRYLDVSISPLPADHPLVAALPDAFIVRADAATHAAIDPRLPRPRAADWAIPRVRDRASLEAIGEALDAELSAWLDAGAGGFRLRPSEAPPAFWSQRIRRARAADPGVVFIAHTPGMAREEAKALEGCGFDWLVSSLAWWDGKAPWLSEEHAALTAVAPLLSEVVDRDGGALQTQAATPAHMFAAAAATASGVLVDADIVDRLGDDEIRAGLRMVSSLDRFDGELRHLTGAAAPVTALLRASGADLRWAPEALLILVNPGPAVAAPDPDSILAAAGGAFEPFEALTEEPPFTSLTPGEVRLLTAKRARPIKVGRKSGRREGTAAAAKPRLVVEGIEPSVDGGALPVKRVVGDRVEVTADAYGDGHELLAAELRWRAVDEPEQRARPMAPLGDDRWTARFPLDRLGRHEFVVEAWLDVFGGFQRDLAKKLAAGAAESVDLADGREIVARARARAAGSAATALETLAAALAASPEPDQVRLLLAAETTALMTEVDDRPFRLRSDPVLVDAERLQSRFASWYELFPRSVTDAPERHGTFNDVIDRLPAVRAMGFDVLYFPPIHPIGLTNRKGRNNSPRAELGEPGSPYAIGSEEGGHDAIHPQLGTFEDFRRLIDAAKAHNLEIALDFAIQCSPDHPWLKEHPGWFDWRPDGTVKYAENPPKTYEDIVNVDFYAVDAVPGLWLALRDVALVWVREGIKTFRVDNPHTKPLPFWEWLIRDVRNAHPEVIFLSEAFTRPKMMYRLAKVGFSQSYTYFTWRHTKAELTDYLTELTTTAAKDFFRPNFFVNTPDINPPFLQTSGRAGFLIRAALAATLSGLWGVYSGFEILESEPLPGREEYKDSEKYEIKPRDWSTPGNIIPDIARLNRIRRSHPALQSHLGLRFYNAFNDQMLYFGKSAPGADDMILVAISLDPHAPQEAELEIPLWEWGLPDDGALHAEDLLAERRFTWRGKIQRVRLEPQQPFAIWRVEPDRGRA